MLVFVSFQVTFKLDRWAGVRLPAAGLGSHHRPKTGRARGGVPALAVGAPASRRCFPDTDTESVQNPPRVMDNHNNEIKGVRAA